MVTVMFIYDEPARKWNVAVTGVKDDLEARHAFNAVILTCRKAIPAVDCNKAERQIDGSYKISVGQFE